MKSMTDTAGCPRILKDGSPQPGGMLYYALTYARLGWLVFPVHGVIINGSSKCTCGDPHCARPGKHPVRELVRNGLNDASTNPALITAWWTNAPWANLAVRTGQQSGIWVLDVDVADAKSGDETLAQLVRANGQIPDTVEAITGSGGRHLFFRYPPDRRIGNTTSKLGPGLDIRGSGGYVVVEPSIHITGDAYAWEGSSDPTEGVEPADAPAWLLALLEECAQPPQGQGAGNGPLLDDRQVLELRQALGYISADDYETWVKVGMALSASGAADQAFGLWNEWSLSSQKYEAKGMRAKWASFKDRPGGIELATIFALAQQAGWVNPASRDAMAFEDKYGVSFAALERQQSVQIVESVDIARTPFPVDTLEHAAQWISTAFPITHPVATDHAVLALASIGAARLYASAQGDRGHCYLGVASRSVGDLRYARTAVHQVLSDAGMRRMIRGTRFTSPQAIYQTMMRAPASLYATEEWGQMVAFAKRQPSGLVEQSLNAISDMYEARSIFLDSAADIGVKNSDDQPTIIAPSLSILALMSHDQLEAIGRKGEWGRGSLEQMLTVIVPESSGLSNKPIAELKTPSWLTEHLCAVRRVGYDGGNLHAIAQENGQIEPSLVTVQWACGCDDHERFLIESVGQEDRRLLPLAYGGIKSMRRLAVAMAAWSDPPSPVVTRAIIDWLGSYVHRHLTAFVDRLQIVGSDEGRMSAYQKVVEMTVRAESRGLSFRELCQQVWAFKTMSADKRNDLIEQLLADKELVEVETGGRRKRVFVAARFCVDPSTH